MGKDNLQKKILKKRKKKKKIKALKKKRREEILRNTPRVIIDGVEIQYDEKELKTEETGKKEKEKVQKQVKEVKEKEKKVEKKEGVVKEKEGVKKGSNLLLYLLPFLTILVLIISFFSFLFVFFSKSYEAWEEEFEKSEILFLDLGEEIDLEEKIQEYNRVTDEYSSIVFSKEEALFLISQALDESLPDWIDVQKVGLDASRGEWDFFLKTEVFERDMPWVKVEISKKEDIQSVDLEVDDIFLGDFSLNRFGFGNVVENVDGGVKRAMQLVNDGNFAGRVFENIELGEEELIIKSRNIENF